MNKWIFVAAGMLIWTGGSAWGQNDAGLKLKTEDNTQANLAYKNDPAFRKAVDDFRVGKYPQAQTELEGVVQKTPGNASAHNMLGYLYLQNKDTDKALTEMEAAVRLNPGDMQARSNLGSVYLQNGHFPEAAAQFKIISDHSPTDDHARFNYALATGQAGNRQDAIQTFRDLTAAHPDALASAPAYRNLGYFLHADGNNADAAAAYQKAAALDPKDTTSLYYAGELDEQSGNHAAAISALSTVVTNEAYPKGDDAARYNAHFTLGQAYAAQKDISNAIAQFRAATDVSPNDFSAWYNLGVMLAQSPGQEQGAEDAYVHALANKKDDPQALSALHTLQASRHAANARQLADQADLDKAADEWRQAVQADPTDDASRLALASYYMGQKSSDGAAAAITQYEEVAKREPQNSAVQNQLGLAYEAQGNHSAALEAFNNAVRLDPKNAQAQNNIGVIYDKQGNKNAAIAAYKKALAIDPTLTVARTNLKRFSQK
ncbi:MAG: tetratricopeptide repeat protein [Armatimonadota bacterium]|nr:tetratricopeptide repeat protein [Armatimonadota bacterium]